MNYHYLFATLILVLPFMVMYLMAAYDSYIHGLHTRKKREILFHIKLAVLIPITTFLVAFFWRVLLELVW